MQDLPAIRWIVAVPLGVLGAWVIVGNFACLALGLARRRHASMVPLIGGVLASASLLACPLRGSSRVAWLPLVVDPGCLWASSLFLYAVVVVRCFRR